MARLFTFDGTGFLNKLTKQQHFFSDGGFTGVGVRNNRKGATFIHFFKKLCRGHACVGSNINSVNKTHRLNISGGCRALCKMAAIIAGCKAQAQP